MERLFRVWLTATLLAASMTGSSRAADAADGGAVPYVEDVAARRARLPAGPPPFLFAISDPDTGRTVHVQGVPPFRSPALYPVHPALSALLDRVDRLIVNETTLAPAELPDGEAGDDFVWNEREKEYRARRLAQIRKTGGGFLAFDPERRAKVWSDVSAGFAVDALVYVLACEDAFRVLLPRTAAAPFRRWADSLWPEWLLPLGRRLERWCLSQWGCEDDPDYDFSIRLFKDPEDCPRRFPFARSAPAGFCVSSGKTEHVVLAVEADDSGAYRFARLATTRSLLRHELGHAFLRGGPDALREHSFVHEGWASVFQSVDPHADDPRAALVEAAAGYTPTPLLRRLAAENLRWPSPRHSFRHAPLAWCPPERALASSQTYDAGAAWAAFLIADPGRADRYDAALARVRERGGTLFSLEELDELAPVYRAWLEERRRADPEAVVLWMKLLRERASENFLPDDGSLSDTLPPAVGKRWRDARPGLWRMGIFVSGLEALPPLAAVAWLESEINLTPTGGALDPEATPDPALRAVHAERVPPLDHWLVAEAVRRGRSLSLEKLHDFPRADLLASLLSVYRSQSASVSPEDAHAAFWRTVYTCAAITSGEFRGLFQIARRSYDAWWDNDPGWMQPDPDWSGWTWTRQASEWRRRTLSPLFARRLGEALASGETVLMAVPMEYLSDQPGGLREACAALGLVARPATAPGTVPAVRATMAD